VVTTCKTNLQTIFDGWLHTGDAGYVDDEGFLYLVDRIKDMIITGGVNVYPKDIEEIIVQYPGVSEVSVFGAPDEKWGEIPVAAVTSTDEIDPAELMAWTNQRVGGDYHCISDCAGRRPYMSDILRSLIL
jgi:long-chain acyl-CoA synthetase